MQERTKNLIKDTLAVLGGIFTVLALIEPWITEEYHLLRFKGLITIVIVFLLFRITILIKKNSYRASLIGFSSLGLLAFWLILPTFPMNLLAWVPTPEEREFLTYNESMEPIDAYKLGMIQLLNNNQIEAIKAFEKANEDERLKPYATDRLAFVERLQGHDTKSLELYDQAIRLAKNAELSSERKKLLSYNWQNRGFLYRRFAHAVRDDENEWGKYQTKAFKSFQYSIEHDPQFHKSWYMMGQIHYDRGELEAAKEAYYRAYFLNTQYDRAAYNLASVEADMGNHEQSLHWVMRTLQINASQAYAIEEDESFTEIKGNERFSDLIQDAKDRLEVVYRARLED